MSEKLSVALAKFNQNSQNDSEQFAAQKMALTAFVVRLFSAGIAFFSHVLFARLIGQFEYGIYAFVWVLVVIFGNLSCFGFHTTLIRFMPQYRINDDQSLFHGLNYAARMTCLAISGTVSLFGIGFLHFFGAVVESYYLVPVVLGLMTLPMVAMGDMLDGTARANGWALSAMQYTYLIRPILIIVLMILCILLGFEHSATVAMQAALAATMLTTLLQYIAIHRQLKTICPLGPLRFEYQRWIRFAAPMFFIDGIGFLLTNADVLLVGIYMPPDQVAIYFAAAKIIVLMQFVFFAVKAAAGPRFSTIIAKNDIARLNAAAKQIAHWCFWPSLAIGIVLLITGPWFLSLFGSEFGAGYPLIAILFIGFLSKSSIGPAETLLNMSGNQIICVWLYTFTFMISIILNITLIPLYGLKGAASATTIAMVLETLLLIATTRKILGIWLTPLPSNIFVGMQRSGNNGQ